MASENVLPSKLETTAPLPFEMKRQHSYTTLARLIGAADSRSGSPATPSPREVAQMDRMVERLEEIDAKSQELLRALFSMLESDARLERYVRRRVDDPKVSHMWVLVEQIMSSKRGHVNFDALLNPNKMNDDVADNVREIKNEGEKDDEDEMRLGRFKIRTFGNDDL